ncbi:MULTISPECIES: DUF3330 domain-containing protein [Legionella]|nr:MULTISPECIES: DUF3330 domain-containing protein [Legionella]
MDMIDLILSRRAVRSFNSRELDEQTIEKILEAARYAPSPQNSQPWHFTLIRNKASLEYLASAAKHAVFLSKAPLLIIVTVNRDVALDDWLIQHNQHVYSGAAAMQNMWLAAWSLDIGCCWVTLDETTTRKLVAIPEEQVLIGALAIGYLDDNLPKPHEEGDRKPLSSMTSFEQFGKSEQCDTESCFTCLKLVPKSAARSFEGEEYIKYFCGQDCYTEWQKQTKKWLNDKK